ncbi:MAG: flagellar assembly protein FliW [Rickettsiaceae bacterium]|nr:flagellar assembly protein FliW [Rickettsiaceae bacterium]
MARLKYKPQTEVKEVETIFGKIVIDSSATIHFPNAILGFPKYNYYCICPIPNNKIPGSLIFQCTENDKLTFLVTPIGNFEESSILKYEDITLVATTYNIEEQNLAILGITRLYKSGQELQATINFMAPLFIDLKEKIGFQHVFLKNNYPINYPHELMMKQEK